MKILVVDDDRMVRECLADILRDLGCEVQAAASAEDALELVASGSAFDLLLTDMQMTGMDGGELVSLLRGLGLSQPMYVLTGLVNLTSVPGATGVLYKPVQLETLEDVIRTDP